MNTKKIKVVATDVDGVLTDGKVFYFKGKLYRSFNIKDGVAFLLLKLAGIQTVIISAKRSEETKQRFSELMVDCYLEGIKNKLSAMEKFMLNKKVKWDEICYIGDDLQDIPLMKKAGLSAAPYDGCKEVKKIADYVCKQRGGDGVFREVAVMILKGKGVWKNTLKSYLDSL